MSDTPKGCKLVPIEPTEAMVEAGRIARMNIAGGYDGPSGWQAMLDASPEPPTDLSTGDNQPRYTRKRLHDEIAKAKDYGRREAQGEAAAERERLESLHRSEIADMAKRFRAVNVSEAVKQLADVLSAPADHVMASEKAIRKAGQVAIDELIDRGRFDYATRDELADYMTRIVDACVRAALASASTVNNPATLEKSDFQKFDVEGERLENEQKTPKQHVCGEPTGYLVKRYDLNGVLLDTELSFTKPIIRSTAKTEFVPLFAALSAQEAEG